ncbi:MAG: class I SAM-dependent rRNA methyltransferase [Rhodospirillales bacterium]|nr:class I SAM-dependent rRNA methyltransferase [Rhodospirillales bacterium]
MHRRRPGDRRDLRTRVTERPVLTLRPGHGRRLRAGAPWAYSNEIVGQALEPGSLVALRGDDGARFGTAIYNPHSLIAARVLDRDPAAIIDAAWFRARFAAAARLRARLGFGPWCRLVHAEADGLPGLIVDRYDAVFVVQANSAGMDRLLGPITEALVAEFSPRAVVARGDSAARRLEGLAEDTGLLHGTDAAAMVEEGGIRFPVDPLGGQKTGWFFDQRANRDLVARVAAGARVLDVFCHTGGFGLRAAAAGAASVLLVDSSAPALDAAMAAVATNGLAGRVAARRGDAFDAMAEYAAASERFDIVVCDPPAFARARKDAEAGLRAYGRMARLAAALVAPGGLLFVASCSHHAPLDVFAQRIAEGLFRARRRGRILVTAGAGADHPVHPALPETAYLKAQLIALD